MRKSTRTALRAALTVLLCAAVIIPGTLLLGHGYRRYMTAIYPLEHQQLVEAAGQEHSIPTSLIYAIIHTESSFEETALSTAEAKGLMQLTDATFRWALNRAGESDRYTPEDLYDPAINIRYGVYVLALLREQFESTDTVLAAYNAGQGRVREWLKDPAFSADGVHLDSIPYKETADYVQRVTAAQKRYQTLYDIQ